jgi:adenine/guanine phosphoribosyltransferase-like PRPP-binding protein
VLPNEIERSVTRLGLLRRGHYRLGGHLTDDHVCVEDYLYKESILCRPDLTAALAITLTTPVFLPESALAEYLRVERPVVVGIERGGERLAPFVAYRLAQVSPHPIQTVCVTARLTSLGTFGFDPREEHYLAHAQYVLVVVDILNRGVKVAAVAEAVASAGDVSIQRILALAERQQPQRNIAIRHIPVSSGLRLGPAYADLDCPRCGNGEYPQPVPEDWYTTQ